MINTVFFASIALIVALTFSLTIVIDIIKDRIYENSKSFKSCSIIAISAWALFYYFSHIPIN